MPNDCPYQDLYTYEQFDLDNNLKVKAAIFNMDFAIWTKAQIFQKQVIKLF